MGRLRCAEHMRRVRINGAPRGHKKTDKARLARERKAEKLKRWLKRGGSDRQERRKATWERRKWTETGLPLIDVAKFGFNDE
jgi:hypothetical protein